MNSERYYRAADIFSHPATGTRPRRRGLIPIGATQFYKLLKAGKFPQPDAKIGCVRLWSDSLIKSTVNVENSC